MGTAVGTCARCESPLERGDLRCAVCARAVPAPAERRTELAVEVLRCDGCGAAVDYDPAAGAPRCAFCDAVVHVERIADPMEQTELWVPFTVVREEALAAVRRWLGGLSWFRPPDLVRRARVDEVRPLWWAGWAFDAEVLVSWAADSDAGAGRAAWAPHAGQTRLSFDDIVVSASRGLTEDEAVAVAERCALASAARDPGGAEPPEGTTREQFDVQRSRARARVALVLERVAAEVVEREHVPGSRHRKVAVEPLVRSLVTRRLSFPAWVLAYRYRDRVYRAVVCGQDAGCVLGDAPWSWKRIALAVAGALAALAGVAGLVALLAG